MRFLGIGEGDEVITSAYTYTASASPVIHVGAKVVLVDVAKDSYEMDYDKLEQAITERTKAIVPVDLGGIICDYERIFEIVERKKALFQPENEIQKAIGRIVVVADAAHAFGARMNIQEEWKRMRICRRLYKLFLPCGKKSDDGRRRGADLERDSWN